MQTNLQASIVKGLGFKFETSQPTAPEETGDAGPPEATNPHTAAQSVKHTGIKILKDFNKKEYIRNLYNTHTNSNVCQY